MTREKHEKRMPTLRVNFNQDMFVPRLSSTPTVTPHNTSNNNTHLLRPNNRNKLTSQRSSVIKKSQRSRAYATGGIIARHDVTSANSGSASTEVLRLCLSSINRDVGEIDGDWSSWSVFAVKSFGMTSVYGVLMRRSECSSFTTSTVHL